MFLLGAAITVAAGISTWIVTAQEDRVRLALHVWGDTIPSLLLPSQRNVQEWGLTFVNNPHPPHPDNCSTCLFASRRDGSPVLVGQKLPHTNYSHFKLLLLPEDSRKPAIDPSISRHGFRRFLRPLWTFSAIAIVVIVAFILFSLLEIHLRHRQTVISGTTSVDAPSTINDKGIDLVVDSQENHERKKTLLEWFAALLPTCCRNLYHKRVYHPDNKRLDKSYATEGETMEGQFRPNGEEEHEIAWMDEDEAFEADHNKNVLELENEIERSLADTAVQQKRIALIKEKDIEIESLRKKLDFTTGKFRKFQREREECRTRHAPNETQ